MTVAIIGAGPAGLMAAEAAAGAGCAVTVYDAAPSPARKFLLAGRGGLNLTHSEPIVAFLERYGAARARLEPIILAFPPEALRDWCAGLGEETFVGSSGRVFPRSFKTSPLLRAWLARLSGMGVTLKPRWRWTGWDGNDLRFETPEGPALVGADACVFALGGASWPKFGSDGAWVGAFQDAGVDVSSLRPANCGVEIVWTDHLRRSFAGAPLKNIALRAGPAVARGEAVIAEGGLEGGLVYAVLAPLREAITALGPQIVHLDLKPDLGLDDIARRIAKAGTRSRSNVLRNALGFTDAMTALLREPGPWPGAPDALAARIKALPLTVQAARPLEKAISSAGGVAWDALDPSLMLRVRPGAFVAGEMIDWEAPTGGYLLQACFATGFWAGRATAAWVKADRPV